MIFKSKKIIFILLVFIIIFAISIGTIKLFKHHKNNNITINYVNKIESSLYENINVYDYNNNSNQYEIKQLIFTKNNIIKEIFYYYNDKFNYKVNDIYKEDDSVIIKLSNDNKNININDFKLIKLTYNQLNIKNIKILYKDQEFIV